MPDARFEGVLERQGSGTFVVVPVDVPAVFAVVCSADTSGAIALRSVAARGCA